LSKLSPMFVSVSFLGLQRMLTRTDRIQVPLTRETRVADVLAYVKKSFPDLPFPENAFLVTVNNRAATMDRVLAGNDDISFLPFIGGG